LRWVNVIRRSWLLDAGGLRAEVRAEVRAEERSSSFFFSN
jgi:hypothetical protein